MTSLKALDRNNNATIATEVRVAANFFSRLKGLLGTSALPEGDALLIRPCNSVHTVGMRYPIDVLFLDKYSQVLKTVSSLSPWRAAACAGSEMVLELPAGTIRRTGTVVGHNVALTAGGKGHDNYRL